RGHRYGCGPFAVGDTTEAGREELASASRRRQNRAACFGGVQAAGAAMAGGEAGVEARYHRSYEDRLNPFMEFTHREEDARYRSLRIHEKITLSSGRFFLGNQWTRTFVFVYTVFLHSLVLYVIYNYSSPATASVVYSAQSD
ncbi:hypothetical protein CYMTET_36778, partial [Cymbomonas tetramitiformis]